MFYFHGNAYEIEFSHLKNTVMGVIIDLHLLLPALFTFLLTTVLYHFVFVQLVTWTDGFKVDQKIKPRRRKRSKKSVSKRKNSTSIQDVRKEGDKGIKTDHDQMQNSLFHIEQDPLDRIHYVNFTRTDPGYSSAEEPSHCEPPSDQSCIMTASSSFYSPFVSGLDIEMSICLDPKCMGCGPGHYSSWKSSISSTGFSLFEQNILIYH